MKLKTDNLAFQIWLSFISLTIILLFWLFLYLKTEEKTKEISVFSLKLTDLQNDFSENYINYQNFIIHGYKEERFYTIDNQPDIDNYLKNLTTNLSGLQKLAVSSEDFNLNTDRRFILIKRDYKKLITLSDSARTAIRYRGFKDFGLEGKMRTSAHQIENLSKISRATILQLRRHEKDFLLRGDTIYQRLFNQLITKTLNQPNLDKQTNLLLHNYAKTFNEYIAKSKELGYYSETGLITDIRTLHDRINSEMTEIKTLTAAKSIELGKTNSNFLIIETIFVAIIAILVCIFLVKTLTYDIKLLNQNFRFYINKDFLNDHGKELPKPDFKLSSIEIRKLFANFQLLKETLNKTLIKLNEEKERSEKNAHYKARFLANMSHEIRTPLNGIIGMLQMIEFDPLSEEQKENMDLAKYSANHLLELVNMILDYSKLEEGKMQLEHVTFNLTLVIENLNGIFRHQVKEKQIEFKVTIDPQLPEYVKGDVLRLQQVLLNLLGNAVKFTNTGSVVVNATLVGDTEKSVLIGFKVQDTGIGISDSEKEKLFEAFVQSDISTTRKYGGTGLGLTISNQLIHLMGGEIKMESILNQGSTFYFELVFDKVQAPEKVKASLINTADLQGKRILVAEDNHINRIVLEKMLKNLELECVMVDNGKKALEIYLSDDFHMILMDIHMPVMNGIEASKAIKNTTKYMYNPIPIVAITASAFEDDRKMAFREGLDDFITKPVLFDKLKLVLKKFLSLKYPV